MSDKPENFVITSHADKRVVERHFELPDGDFIAYRRTINSIKGKDDPTIKDLHNASADLVIRQLLKLLPEGHGSKNPYAAGEKK